MGRHAAVASADEDHRRQPRAAVYGTIAASAVIAAAAVGHLSAAHILVSTLATLVVFWLAHVYAGLLDHGRATPWPT